MSRKLSVLSAIALLVSAGLPFIATLAQAAPRALPEHVPGELVVKFRDAASSRAGTFALMSTLSRRLGALSVQSVQPLATDQSLAVVKLKDEGLTISALHVLQGEPAVVYAEPNYIYHTQVMNSLEGTPNDPSFAQQWNLVNTGQADSSGHKGIAGDDINVLPLWNKGVTGKKSVVVAIIDTGIQWDHPDLKDNLYTNPGEIAGNGTDDDHNGFVDDIHGWNFNGKKNDSNDDNGHGTHCAGVIGASTNNGVGVAGINWNVSLMPVKFLDRNGGGNLADAVDAINYARMMKVNVMSNSWGGAGSSDAMLEAIQNAEKAGILFIAASGNNSGNNDGANNDAAMYPATYPVANIVSVAALTNQNQLAKFSNFGPTTVHVAAPGLNILSTFKKSKYKVESGTSMAAPHVSGISALLISEHPEWTYQEVKDRLIKTSTPLPALEGKIVGGRVNAETALYGAE